MVTTMQVEVVSAEQEIFSGQATMLVATGVAGELGIMPNHTPLLTQLKPGDVRVFTGSGKEQIIYVSGGILEVTPKVITVLSDTALRAEELDEAAALETQQRAQRALADKKADIGWAKARAELAQAAAQLAAIRKLKRRG